LQKLASKSEKQAENR